MRERVPTELIQLDKIARSLAETRSLKEVKAVRDKAEAARHYARGAALGLNIQNQAAELKLRAERRAGELLSDIVVHGGNRRSNSHDDNLKLADLGIDHNQSSRWQRVAAIPEAMFRKYVAETNSVGKEITTQGLLRLGRAINGKVASGESNGKSQANVSAKSPSVHGETISELFDELHNHRDLLEQVLADALSDKVTPLPRPQQRLTLRLLNDIKEVVDCLQASVAKLFPKM